MKTLKMNIMYRYIKNFTILFLGIAIVSSCSKDILPRNQETADTVFNDPKPVCTGSGQNLRWYCT